MFEKKAKKTVNDAVVSASKGVLTVAATSIGAKCDISEFVTVPLSAFAGTLLEKILVKSDEFMEHLEQKKLLKKGSKKLHVFTENVKVKICVKLKKIVDCGLENEDILKNNDNHILKDEITEAIFLSVQKEYEEKKLPYLENFYANIMLSENIEPSLANSLVRAAAEISYQQILILACIGSFYDEAWFAHNEHNLNDNIKTELDSIIVADIKSLLAKSIISISDSYIVDVNALAPSVLVIKGFGQNLYDLMELNTITEDNKDYKRIVDFFKR